MSDGQQVRGCSSVAPYGLSLARLRKVSVPTNGNLSSPMPQPFELRLARKRPLTSHLAGLYRKVA